MLLKIISFELNFWRKRIVTYVFALILFLLTIVLLTAENVSMGTDVVYRNSPSGLLNLYFFYCILLPLFVTCFMSSAITRDYENNFDQILYSSPVSRNKILIGRFIGGSIILSLLFLGVITADLVSPFLPWTDTEFLGPFRLDSHIQNYFCAVLPNIFVIGSILFLISSWAKSLSKSFLAAIAIVVIFMSFQTLNEKIDNKTIAALIDPFGIMPIFYYTKKWTALEKNTLLYQVDWKYFANRAIWGFFSLGLWFLALKSFSLKFLQKKLSKKEKVSEPSKQTVLNIPATTKDYSLGYILKNLHYQAKVDFLHIIKSPAFFVVLGLIIMILSLTLVGMVQTDSGLGDTMATTSNTLNFMESVNFMMQLGIIYFAGMLIWKERESKVNEIYDSMPVKTYSMYLGKLLSIIYLMICLSTILLICGLCYQLIKGVYHIDWIHYFAHLFGISMFRAICLAIFSMFLQIIINNKFIAYFVSCILLIGEDFLIDWLDISSNMATISPTLPRYVHSDFYGYGIYKTSLLAFMGYWILIYAVIAFVSYWFFVRGKEYNFKNRWKDFKQRFFNSKLIFIPIALLTILFSSFMYYQTQIKHTYYSREESLERSAYYEKTFKKYKDVPSPKATHVDYKINLYPNDRTYDISCKINMVNKEDTFIKRIYINNEIKNPAEIKISGAKLIAEDKKSTVNFQTYEFENPLQVGDSFLLEYTYKEVHSGVENEIENERLLTNGTFMDFGSFTPMLGYQEENEIFDKSDREKYDLPVKAERLPALQKTCSKACMRDYIGGLGDWVTIHTAISTDEDQIAIAPGSLTKEWNENGRRYFEYDLSQPSKFFFSIVSGKYKVLKDTTRGVACEVYYIPAHEYNTKTMLYALKRSIEYYSDNFGPYKHKVARIIEFPKFESFAQAFPGTMPYSERIGFTANIVENPEDVNEVFHIVAHEMAHQWWAHQVTGAKMQGATLLSESLAEYSSLKLLEKEYGIDMAAKFLKQSNNGYIFSRAMETKKESALFQVDNQGYIHYQKGSVVMYAIQQLIGEEKMNLALSNLVKKYGYKEPPYPNSYAFLDEIYPLVPDSFKHMVRNGLEEIVIFKTDIEEVKTKKLAENKYETTIEFELLKNASDPDAKQMKNIRDIKIGQSKKVPVRDYFDIAVYEDIDDKSRYGKLIKKQRYFLNSEKNKLKIISSKKPDKIVVDPYFIHIHKDPQENIKKL